MERWERRQARRDSELQRMRKHGRMQAIFNGIKKQAEKAGKASK